MMASIPTALRPRPQRPPRPAPRAWLPPVSPPPLADQIARWASDLGRLDLI